MKHRIRIALAVTALMFSIGLYASAQDLVVLGTVTGQGSTYLATNSGASVGIGTATPAAKLDVAGPVSSNRNWYYLAGAGDTNHAIGNISGDGEQFRYWQFLDFYSPAGGGNIRFTSNGNVGIGTTSPGFPLHVTGRIATGAPGSGGIWVDGGAAQFVGSYDSTHLGLYNSGWNFILGNNGYVGIGTAAPAYKLEVAGDIRATGAWLRTTGNTGWYSDTYGGGWYMQDTSWIRSYGSKAVYMDSGFDTAGAAGVSCGGGLGGGYNLRVCGTAAVTSTLTVTGTVTSGGDLVASGKVYAPGARAIYACPDNQYGSCFSSCRGQASTNPTCTYKTQVGSGCSVQTYTGNCSLLGRIIEP